ncbi:methylated-DNA-[protein]-cysteine S-methyltransferase [Rhodoblastus acidophilus]|uniref:methylated-DNA--[protein]-cysteine S-methyltransferase n=1 Tax=Rhodoblastus acidophilus TaxID=1074 RepID=UPI0022246625|nr:methylated-DNA--[protein]-cysteine S-methyltransferase [Rhodoblastus acidophilus]MCW2282369.1 methylated-DNA-[protein]-cysteine S-methyltransferase [Rhodoblastus acidophilus]MCW2331226.1 methylated-DNA-[protein]-cysteine S-methyltransferase [Rhodoblastus acidophilus]
MMETRLFLETLPTPTGALRLVTDGAGAVRLLDWGEAGDAAGLRQRLSLGLGRVRLDAPPRASAALVALDAYFGGEAAALDALSVAPAGTPFQQQVWAALRTIPDGATASYGEIARRIGQPGAARAVGLANNRNPIVLVIPCHRVIGASGALVGYGGGLERKLWLLRHEGAMF